VLVVDPGGGNVLIVTSLEDVEDDIDAELARGRAAMDADEAADADSTDSDPAREDEPERA